MIELDIDQPSTHGIIDLIVVLDRRSETAAGRLAAKEGIPLLRLPGGHIPCGLPLLLKGAFVREFPVLNVRGIGTVPQIAVASARVEARGHDAELIPKLEGIQLMPPVSFLCAQGPAPFGGPAQREVRAVGFESMLVTAPYESGATLVVSASTLLTVVIPDGRSAVMRTGPLGYWRAGQSSVLAWAPSGSGSSRVAPIIGRFDEASNRSPPDVAPVVGV